MLNLGRSQPVRRLGARRQAFTLRGFIACVLLLGQLAVPFSHAIHLHAEHPTAPERSLGLAPAFAIDAGHHAGGHDESQCSVCQAFISLRAQLLLSSLPFDATPQQAQLAPPIPLASIVSAPKGSPLHARGPPLI